MLLLWFILLFHKVSYPVPLGEDPEEDSELAGRKFIPTGLEMPHYELEAVAGESDIWGSLLDILKDISTPDEQKIIDRSVSTPTNYSILISLCMYTSGFPQFFAAAKKIALKLNSKYKHT